MPPPIQSIPKRILLRCKKSLLPFLRGIDADRAESFFLLAQCKGGLCRKRGNSRHKFIRALRGTTVVAKGKAQRLTIFIRHTCAFLFSGACTGSIFCGIGAIARPGDAVCMKSTGLRRLVEAMAAVIALLTGIHRFVPAKTVHALQSLINKAHAIETIIIPLQWITEITRIRTMIQERERTLCLFSLTRFTASIKTSAIAVVALFTGIDMTVAAEIRTIEETLRATGGRNFSGTRIAFFALLHLSVAAGDWLRALRRTNDFFCNRILLIQHQARLLTTYRIMAAGHCRIFDARLCGKIAEIGSRAI